MTSINPEQQMLNAEMTVNICKDSDQCGMVGNYALKII